MATNPMLQAVMLFGHHQTTTPFLPIPPAQPVRAATQEEKKPKQDAPFDTEEEEEEEQEENGSEEKEEGEKHG